MGIGLTDSQILGASIAIAVTIVVVILVTIHDLNKHYWNHL